MVPTSENTWKAKFAEFTFQALGRIECSCQLPDSMHSMLD